MERRKVTVERSGGRGRVAVIADVCSACGERYFDLEAMAAMEAAVERSSGGA